MNPALDTLRHQLNGLIETAAADLLETQAANEHQRARLIQAAQDAGFKAGDQNGRTLERARCLSIVDHIQVDLKPDGFASPAVAMIRERIISG